MAEASVQVVYTDPGGEGYHCVLHMARLAARLLDGELVLLKPGRPRLIDKLGSALPPAKDPNRATLLICPAPPDLNTALLIDDWRKSHGRLVAWVFDSFWTNSIPRWVRSSRVFDHVFVTECEDLNVWRKTVPAPVDWLPWGSDVLNLGSSNGLRDFDLLRFGRQPPEWNDDAANAERCRSKGLRFHGRPTSFDDATDNERELMITLSKAKFSLAFSNRVSRSVQTHPDREYITGRWTDALASGTTVAGMPPRSESVESLLWPEALLDMGTATQAEGLEVVASAVRDWTPARAEHNYRKALEVLDWRWRFKTIAEALGVRAVPLENELARLSGLTATAVTAGNID